MRLRLARSTVFSTGVRSAYGMACAVTGLQISAGNQLHEVEAAHVVPLERGGCNDPRNGIALCRTLHWAFDRGLFGVSDDRKVIVPARILSVAGNEPLGKIVGRSLREADRESFRVHRDCLAWHRDNVMGRFDHY